MKSWSILVALVVVLGLAAVIGFGLVAADDRSSAVAGSSLEEAAIFTEDGKLQRPKGYREWVFVGAPVTPNDMNNGKAPFPEFHSVYVDPTSYEHWKKTGKWRSGTVMAKELVKVGRKVATSGKGYFMGDFAGLEVSVKHAKRFPDEPGNWSFYRFTDEETGAVTKTAEALPSSACAACHASAARDDLVFTQYYPVLRAAKSFGSGRPEDR